EPSITRDVYGRAGERASRTAQEINQQRAADRRASRRAVAECRGRSAVQATVWGAETSHPRTTGSVCPRCSICIATDEVLASLPCRRVVGNRRCVAIGRLGVVPGCQATRPEDSPIRAASGEAVADIFCRQCAYPER